MLIRDNHGRTVRVAACFSLTAAAMLLSLVVWCAPASAQSRDRERQTQEQQKRQPTIQKTTTTYSSAPAPRQQQQPQQQQPSPWFNPPTMGSTSSTMASSSPTMAPSSPTFGSRQPYFVPSPYPDTALPPMRTPQLAVPSSTWPGQQQQQPHIIYKSQQRYGSSNSQREREAWRQRDSGSHHPLPYPSYGSGGSITVLPGGTTVITPGALPDYGPVMPGGSLQVINKGPRGGVTLFDGYTTI